jgi:hypothetical protein
MRRISRGSNGLGIERTKPCVSPLSNPRATASDGGSRELRDATAAYFISSLMLVAPTSSAPRKMNRKHRTLLTWFGSRNARCRSSHQGALSAPHPA